MSGPHRAYLDHGLAQGQVPKITAASVDWMANSGRLATVAAALRKAAGSGDLLGGQTGPAMFEAMMESSKRLDFHSKQMEKGYNALVDSRTMLQDARDARDAIDQDLPPHTKQTYKPDPDLDDAENQIAKTMYDNNQSTVASSREEEREQRARKVVENFDTSYQHPIKVMQQIYGYEEPLPGSTPAVDNGIGDDLPPGTATPPGPRDPRSRPGLRAHPDRRAHPGRRSPRCHPSPRCRPSRPCRPSRLSRPIPRSPRTHRTRSRPPRRTRSRPSRRARSPRRVRTRQTCRAPTEAAAPTPAASRAPFPAACWAASRVSPASAAWSADW